jgi:hypothetical protein
MSERPPSRPAQAVRLQRVTVRVPKNYAEDLRRFARELRTRQSDEPAVASATQWRRLSPSAELLIDPECQAWSIIRDTRALGPNRFHWRVLAPDQFYTVVDGHTGKITRAHWLAEMALRAFVDDWRELSGRQDGDV